MRAAGGRKASSDVFGSCSKRNHRLEVESCVQKMSIRGEIFRIEKL